MIIIIAPIRAPESPWPRRGRRAGPAARASSNILYYTILYYTILYYTILCYTILYYTILYYTILYYTHGSFPIGLISNWVRF